MKKTREEIDAEINRELSLGGISPDGPDDPLEEMKKIEQYQKWGLIPRPPHAPDPSDLADPEMMGRFDE